MHKFESSNANHDLQQESGFKYNSGLMKRMPDPWPVPRISPDVRRRLEEVARRGDLRDKLADLSFIRETTQAHEKWSRCSAVIGSFKTESELKIWWQEVEDKFCNCERKSKRLFYRHAPDCRAVDEFLKLGC